MQRRRRRLALILFSIVLPPVHPTAAASRRHVLAQARFRADRYAAQNSSARDLVLGADKLYRDNASTLTHDPCTPRSMIRIPRQPCALPGFRRVTSDRDHDWYSSTHEPRSTPRIFGSTHDSRFTL